MNEWDAVTYLCNGTPAEFLYIVLVGGTDDENEIDYGSDPDRYYVTIKMYPKNGYAIFRARKEQSSEVFQVKEIIAECKISATPWPNDSSKSLLTVSMVQGDWQHVEQPVMSLLHLAEAEQGIEMQGQARPIVKRGRKRIPPAEQRTMVKFYLEHQTEIGLEAVGGRFGYSGRTVQRYVKKAEREDS